LGGETLAAALAFNAASFNTSPCHAVFGSYLLTSARIGSPLYRASLAAVSGAASVMVYEGDIQPAVNIWAFGQPLTWQLWVVFAVTVVVLPFVFFVVEKLCLEGYIPLSKSCAFDLRFAVCECTAHTCGLEHESTHRC
jgi:hypothetical protein